MARETHRFSQFLRRRRDSAPWALPDVEPGQGSEKRLLANHRVPINIWGDVMTDGSPPEIRRVITGQDAHESLLVYYYLAEILTLQEVIAGLPKLSATMRESRDLLRRFNLLRGTTADPHHHMQLEILQVFVPAVLFLEAAGESGLEVCELGCSFFSAIDKMRVTTALLDASIDLNAVRWAAVDHSDFFLRGAVALHPEDKVEQFSDYTDWVPAVPLPFHLSRFVASYATNSTHEFVDWMRQFSAFHIIDVINLGASDFVTSNNGLRQTFFNLPALVGACAADGWNLYLNEATPDFNSGRKCAVVKIFGIREDLETRFHIREQIAARPELRDLLPMRSLSGTCAEELLLSLQTSLTPEEWAAMAEYKRHFPIWGGPVQPVGTLDDVHQVTRAPEGGLDLVFGGGQINYYVRQALGSD